MDTFIDCLERSEFRIIGRFASGFILLHVGPSVYILDQHAVHERSRLEMLQNVFKTGKMAEELTLLDRLCIESLGGRPLDSDKVLELLKTRACKGKSLMICRWRFRLGAIKITDSVDNTQIKKILARWAQCRFPFICAHGRPSLTLLKDCKIASQ